MPTNRVPVNLDVTDLLMSATVDVSRAHLLLSGTMEWVPPAVRPHTHEALEMLDQAMRTLRDAVASLDDREA